MFFDTHCHLNFKAFDGQVDEVVKAAKAVGVNQIIIPGTDIETSEKAIKIAEEQEGIYAAIGVHPHHVYEFLINPKRLSQRQESSLFLSQELKKIENLLSNKKVVAVGEVGLDRHIYDKTKYDDYKIDENFIELQKVFLKEQIKLAVKYEKSLILHNREAKKDMFEILNQVWDKKLEGRTVFHCCEPSKKLLEFAVDKKMFIGVDGDLIYYKEKQEFIKTVPLEILVLETDAPFLSPTRQFPNEPKNILLIAECVAKLKNISIEEVSKVTTENARKLFRI
jgi:TatD DNase family protein